jgi:uncharacterized glyoxalase superfamily protein PhnB
MTDPLDALRLPVVPVAPDPGFARDLRARLARALTDLDRGGAMTPTDATTTTPVGGTARRPSLSAYLAVDGAREAARWYVEVFDGRLGEVVEMPDGRLGHAEVHIGDSVLLMADEFPEMGLLGPRARGGTTVSLVVDVADVDRTAARAVEAGAVVEREPDDMPYGFRAAAVADPFGHRWLIEGPLSTDLDAAATAGGHGTLDEGTVSDEPPDTRPGDIAYVTWRVRDEQRTARFLGELLGWRFSPGHVEHGLQVEGANLRGGLWGGHEAVERADAKLMYHVADIGEAVAKVRAMGGTATEPELQPYGWSSECTDDQGMEFWIYAPAEG